MVIALGTSLVKDANNHGEGTYVRKNGRNPSLCLPYVLDYLLRIEFLDVELPTFFEFAGLNVGNKTFSAE